MHWILGFCTVPVDHNFRPKSSPVESSDCPAGSCLVYFVGCRPPPTSWLTQSKVKTVGWNWFEFVRECFLQIQKETLSIQEYAQIKKDYTKKELDFVVSCVQNYACRQDSYARNRNHRQINEDCWACDCCASRKSDVNAFVT